MFRTIKSNGEISDINFAEKHACNDYPAPSRCEAVFVIVFLGLLFLCRLLIFIYLKNLGVIEQYDIFFDADPIQYMSAISNGWSFGRSVHPAIALIFNVPARALDAGLVQLGLFQPGAFRSFLPMLIAPIFSSAGGYWWWLAAHRSGFTIPARLAGLLMLQIAFSQVVFSVLPESFPISGALLCLVLLLSAKAVSAPETLNHNLARMQWLGIACLMSVITVTNGFMCIAVWIAIRFESGKLGRTLVETAVGCIGVVFAILVATSVDRLIYKPENNSARVARDFADVEVSVLSNKSWIKKYSIFDVSEIIFRAVKFPADLLASVVSPEINLQTNPSAKPEHRHKFKFTLEPGVRSLVWIIMGYFMSLSSVLLIALSRPPSLIVRAIGVVLIFNAALHSIFGIETFLYSQHWLAFLIFAIVWPFRNVETIKNIILLYFFVLLMLILNTNSGIFIINEINSTL